MTSQAGSSWSVRQAPWKWFLALGVVLLVLGVAGAGAASLLEFTSVLIFGPMLLASSLLQFLLAIAGGAAQRPPATPGSGGR